MSDTEGNLRQALVSIIGDWPDLENINVSGGNVTGGANENQLPGGTQRMSLVTEVATLAMQWTLMRLDEWDREEGTLRAEDSTPGRLGFLLKHSEWMASHPIVHEAEEFVRLSHEVRSLVAPSGIRRVPVGACPVQDCGGSVFAAMRDGGDGTLPDLTCDLDREHLWPEPHYQRLAAMLGCDGPERLTVAEFIEYVDGRYKRELPPQTVRSWIRRHPAVVGWDGETLDRIKAVAHYLDKRMSRAA